MEQNRQLKPREQAVLDYIRLVTARQGYPPSVRDICAALGYKSTSTVQMYLDRLLSYGVLFRENGKSRSLRPVEEDKLLDLQAFEVKIANKIENEAEEKGRTGVITVMLPQSYEAGMLFAFYAADDVGDIARGDLCIATRQSTSRTNGVWVYPHEGDGFLITTTLLSSGQTPVGYVIARLHAEKELAQEG